MNIISPRSKEKLENTSLSNVGIFGNSHVGGLATTGLTNDMCGDLNKGSSQLNMVERHEKGEFGDGWKIGDYLKTPSGGTGKPTLKEEFHEYVKDPNLTSMMFRFGGNEINAEVSDDEYIQQLQQLIDAINVVRTEVSPPLTTLDPITPIFVTNPTHPGLSTHDKRKSQNEALRSRTETNEYPLIDVANIPFTQQDFQTDANTGNYTNPHLTMGGGGGYSRVQQEIEKIFENT